MARLLPRTIIGGAVPYKFNRAAPSSRRFLFPISDPHGQFDIPVNALTKDPLRDFAFKYPSRVFEMLTFNHKAKGIIKFARGSTYPFPKNETEAPASVSEDQEEPPEGQGEPDNNFCMWDISSQGEEEEPSTPKKVPPSKTPVTPSLKDCPVNLALSELTARKDLELCSPGSVGFVPLNLPRKTGRTPENNTTASLSPSKRPNQGHKRTLSDESLAQGQPPSVRQSSSHAGSIRTRASKYSIASQQKIDQQSQVLWTIREEMMKASVKMSKELATRFAEAVDTTKNIVDERSQSLNPGEVRKNVKDLGEAPKRDNYTTAIKDLAKVKITEKHNRILDNFYELAGGSEISTVGLLWPMTANVLEFAPIRKSYPRTPAGTIIPFVPNGLTGSNTWQKVRDAVDKYRKTKNTRKRAAKRAERAAQLAKEKAEKTAKEESKGEINESNESII
ncbi:hypothetical protein MY11210_009473 [Beauveria gryllotalpidicola]